MKPELLVSVSEAGTPAARVFSRSVFLEGEAMLENQALTPVESLEAREMSGQYFSLFEKGCKVEMAQDYFGILGEGLFHIFLEKAWEKVEAHISQGARLVVASEITEILTLPWELLLFPGYREAVGTDPKFSIRRVSRTEGMKPFSGALPPGPLRVLFMACQPLDFEREEKWFLQIMEGQDVAFEICDTGSFQDLKDSAERFQPHMVHISGQGKMKGGTPMFSFEGPGGRPDLRSSAEIGRALVGAGVQCLILGGCQSETPSTLNLLSQHLAGYLPMATAWNASTEMAGTFYESLAKGKAIDAALMMACQESSRLCQSQNKVCPFPNLYSLSGQDRIFDPHNRSRVPFLRKELRPLPGLFEGYAEDFVDRRRDLQRLTSALREGTARSVIITGQKGSGKSSLAAKLAQTMASEGYLLLPVYGSGNNSLSAARLLEAGIKALASAGLTDMALRLRDSGLPVSERLKIMLDAINKGRFLVVLDSFSQDEKSRKIKDPELAEFYKCMLKEMSTGRFLATSQALPADALTLPSGAWEWSLGGMYEAAFTKFLLKDPNLWKRYTSGELGYARLQEFYASAAGLCTCLSQTAQALLQVEGDFKLCDEILAALYNCMSLEERTALSRAAAYETAINPAALAAATKIPEKKAAEMVKKWQDGSFIHSVRDGLLVIPSSARLWLLSNINLEEQRSAHEAAGNFLRDLAESGRSSDLGLTRLDSLMEARGHYLASEDLNAARAVTSRICSYLERHGYFHEIVRLNQELLSVESHKEPMNWIARAYLDQGNYALAQKWYSQALEAGTDAVSCHGLATAYFRQEKYEQAREGFQEAAELCRSANDLQGEAAALHGLASIDMEQKKDEAALEKLQTVLHIQERLGDFKGQAATLHQMSILDLRQGKYEPAREKILKSLEILQATGEKAREASAWFNLASLDLENEEFDSAREEFEKALALKQELGDRKGEAAIHHGLGTIEVQKDEKDLARESFLKALRIYQDLGDKPGEAGALFQLGVLAVQEDKMPEGLRLMALSAVILRSISSEEVKNVEPLVERLASQLRYSQEQFMQMVSEVVGAYRRDRGRDLLQKAFGK